jgi:hypothetical protein
MPRPTKPVPGEEIRHDTFGQPVVAYSGENLRFVRNKQSYATAVSNTTGAATATPLELTQLPANDPKVAFAEVSLMVRDAAGINASVTVFDADEVSAGTAYSSGTASRGGHQGPFRVPIRASGVNRRSIKWSGTATAKCWIYVWGWWETVA